MWCLGAAMKIDGSHKKPSNFKPVSRPSNIMKNRPRATKNYKKIGKSLDNHKKKYQNKYGMFGHLMVKMHLNNTFNILIDFFCFILV